jgi:hypothetical protein
LETYSFEAKALSLFVSLRLDGGFYNLFLLVPLCLGGSFSDLELFFFVSLCLGGAI